MPNTATDFNPRAAGRFYVLRNGRTVANAVRSQADVLAEDESQHHPRSTVQVINAATGELAATWISGKTVARGAEGQR